LPKKYTAKLGDCTSSIAFEHGFFAPTIWNDAANSALREQREDMNVLAAGDVVTIPDKREKEEPIETGRLHEFKRRGTPARFRLQVMNVDQPRADVAFKLRIDDKITQEGTTDADGVIDVPLPPNAKRGLLTIEEAQYELRFGALDPVTSDLGARQRLANLGFLCKPDAPEQDLRAALEAFQSQHELSVTGVADDETQQKLLGEHDTRQASDEQSPQGA
jgi:N-acetylmuramoyl-L-alanine amidase